jgi:2-oxoglutarate ferredoxin oxidoreductase subunit alpha
MNPAALKANLGDLPHGGALVVNEDAFTASNLQKVGYASNPLTDGSLASWHVFSVPISTLNGRALEGLGLTNKQVDLTKNFFALGLMFWLYERSMEPTIAWIEQKFSKRPEIAEGNRRALRAGYAFGETTEIFHERYIVPPAKLPAGTYKVLAVDTSKTLDLSLAQTRGGVSEQPLTTTKFTGTKTVTVLAGRWKVYSAAGKGVTSSFTVTQ